MARPELAGDGRRGRGRGGGEWCPPTLFQKLEKLESPGEKTGGFSLWTRLTKIF